MRKTLSLLFVFAILLGTDARAENWPAWRGPTGQGHSAEKDPLLNWSDSQNVKWKIPLEHQGNSTPVVWDDKIFLTQADKNGHTRSLLCFARADGERLWQKDVSYAEKEQNWNDNWYANASPAIDGERVVVSFASAGMYCYDFEGKELWNRTDLGKWAHKFGNGSSPVLYGDLAILWCGPNEKQGRNFLLAVNKETGKTVWEHEEKDGSWGTPLIIKHEGQDQLLLATTPHFKGLDPKTGKELWRCEGLNKYVYTSPLYADGVAVAMSGYRGAALAVKLGGSGDITKDRLWLHPQNTQRVGSGAIVDQTIYLIEEPGIPHAYDLTTGEEVWQVKKRPSGGRTWGSMVHADGKLYALMRNGSTQIFNADRNYELLATNELKGEETNSSIVISDGEILIRTFKHLWCFARPE